MKDFYKLYKDKTRNEQALTHPNDKDPNRDDWTEINDITKPKEWRTSGPERYFEPTEEEIFDPSAFTLIFIDSDSVTNVTSLNRVNKRRVLIFIGNGEGLVSYGKGKSDDYEQAFDQAFKKLRQNLVCIPLSFYNTVPTCLRGHHNDFKIKLWSQ